MPTYRGTASNYYSDKQGQYSPVGTILPVVIDQHTDPTNTLTGRPTLQQEEYNYPGWIYTDGEQYKVRDYPQLYNVLGVRYNQAGESADSININSVTAVGSIQSMWWDSDKLYFSIENDSTLPANFGNKRAYPYNAVVSFIGLGDIPTGLFDTGYGKSYALQEDDSSVTPAANTTTYRVLNHDGNDFDGTQYTQANYTIDFNSNLMPIHPQIVVRKAFDIQDYPYLIGNFRVPDYRERKVLGYGSGVEGGGTPIVENKNNVSVGVTGGQWYIPKTRLDDPGSFYEIGDVRTTGYDNVTTFVDMNLTGSVKYTVGPMVDSLLARPPEHDHYLLHSRANTSGNPVLGGVQDSFTTWFQDTAANIEAFVPETASGLPLAHSHGLTGTRLQNAATATYGNVPGIGEVVDDSVDCKFYKVTQAPPLAIALVTSDGVDLTVSCNSSHGLSVGNWITITGAGGAWDGNYEISIVTSSTALVAQKPAGGTMPNGTMPTGGVVRQADGYFEAVPQQDDPHAFVVDDATVIGNQDIITYSDANLVLAYDVEFLGSGQINKTVTDAGTGVVKYVFTLAAAGGAGGGATSNGGDGGDCSLTFTLNGTQYTINAGGGKGGKAGNSGSPQGGNAGQWSISPNGFANETGVSLDQTENGNPGNPGGQANIIGGAGGLAVGGGYGAGGQGAGEEFSEETTTYYPGPGSGNWKYGTSGDGGGTTGGSLNYPNATEVKVWISGGKGGDGNGPGGGTGTAPHYGGHSGCTFGLSDGGIGHVGSELNLVWTENTQGGAGINWSYQLGSRGGYGTAQYELNAGSEVANNNTGKGAYGANGGSCPGGALGNAGTGGCGGGGSSIFSGTTLIAGAGGGGGGGGSGGGWNGFSPWDRCDGGGDGSSPGSGLHQGYALQGNAGLSGGGTGCTAGSGGGGGGGYGNTPASGGNPGQDAAPGGGEGDGHGNHGGGYGGTSGQSAWNTNFFDTCSLNPYGSSQQGRIRAEITELSEGILPAGAGGGSGAAVQVTITSQDGTDLATAVNGYLGTPGAGGGSPGGDGYIRVECFRADPATPSEPIPTVATGRAYKVPNYPVDKVYNQTPTLSSPSGTTAIWQDANPDGKIKVRTPVGDGFALFPESNNQDSNGNHKITRHIRFEGDGTRVLTLGPFNSLYIDTLYFDIIKGNGTNGGETPDENLMLKWKETLEGNTTLATGLVLTSASDPNWNTYSYQIPNDPNHAMRKNIIFFDLVQERPPSNEVPENTAFNDNFGVAQLVLTYNERIIYQFTPSSNASIPGNMIVGNTTCGQDEGIDMVRREVTALKSGMFVNGGTFKMNSSNPLSITSSVVVQNEIPLITKYFRSKYLIKAT